MSHTLIFFAVSIPCFAILVSLIISVWLAVKASVSDVKGSINEIREDIREIRSDIKIIVGKIAEMDTRLTVIEARVR